MKMVCAALQAPLGLARKPSANQRANQAQINAQIIFPRTSVIFEMRRKPFCQLRKPFWRVAQIILPAAQTICPCGASHFEKSPGLLEPDYLAGCHGAQTDFDYGPRTKDY